MYSSLLGSEGFDDSKVPACVAGSALCAVYMGFASLLLHNQLIIARCGTCCGVVLMILAILPMFFGGVPLNAIVWAYMTMATCGCPAGFCCAFPYFILFAMIISLSATANAPAGKYVLLDSYPALHGASICNGPEWQDSIGGVYFRDGALTRHRSPTVDFVGNITHCVFHQSVGNAHKGETVTPAWWESCDVGVRPVFESDDLFSKDDPPCAWALELGGAPEQPDCSNKGNLCGFALTDSLQSLLLPGQVCWGDDATIGMTPVEGCWRGVQELEDIIRADARTAGVTFERAGAPLIFLKSPQQERQDLKGAYDLYWYAALCYVPLTVALGLLTLCACGTHDL